MSGLPAELWSLDELADHAARFDGRIVGKDAWDRIFAIPRLLPAVFSFGGLECRLGRESDRVDYHGCILATSGRTALARWFDRPHELPASWRRTTDFLRGWSDPASSLHSPVAAVWLEFDLDGERPPSPFPIATLTPPWKMDRPWSRERIVEVASDVLVALAGEPLPPKIARNVGRAILELPSSSHVAHVALPERPGAKTVRLILNLPWQELGRYLQRIGGEFDGAKIEAWLRPLCAAGANHAFHLDVGETFGERLSCEFHYEAGPRRDPRWLRLFSWLADEGDCDPAKLDDLLRWWTHESSPAVPHPISRDFLLKVDYGTDRAKAYLPFRPL